MYVSLVSFLIGNLHSNLCIHRIIVFGIFNTTIVIVLWCFMTYSFLQREWEACIKHYEHLLPIQPDATVQDNEFILNRINIETGGNFLFFTYFLKPCCETRKWTYKLAFSQFENLFRHLQIYAAMSIYINSCTDVLKALKTMYSYMCNEKIGEEAYFNVDLRYFYCSEDGRGKVLGEAVRRTAFKVISAYKEYSHNCMFEQLILSVSRKHNQIIVGFRVEEAVILSLSSTTVLELVLRNVVKEIKQTEIKDLLQNVEVKQLSEQVCMTINNVPGIVICISDNPYHPRVDAIIQIVRKTNKSTNDTRKPILVGIQITIQDPIPKKKCKNSECFLTSYSSLYAHAIDTDSVFVLYISPTIRYSDPQWRSKILHIPFEAINPRLIEALHGKR